MSLEDISINQFTSYDQAATLNATCKNLAIRGNSPGIAGLIQII
jgi:hypothetical protein